MAASLEEITRALGGLSKDKRAQVTADALKVTQGMRWVPNPGPQEQAYYCEADELFFGGSAGGGKSQLVVGLAANCHQRSLILREFNEDAAYLYDCLLEIMGSPGGFNGQYHRYRGGKQLIQFAGLPNEKDKQRYKGNPFDLYAFDEVPDFFESQYLFITGWNRSTTPGQRCRIVATGNPPTRAKGMWVIKHWAPWLDPTHPNPAADGELRWYLRNERDEEVEVDGPGPFLIDGRSTVARSRTFIRSKLEDNPDLVRTNYDATLASLPKELRDAYRDGRFDASLKDHPFQVIPTAWIKAAQERWLPDPPEGVPMCAMGVDPVGGGKDKLAIATRYDAWFAPILTWPGAEIKLGSEIAGKIVVIRRDNADIVLDMGGGYGGGCYQTLRENEIPVMTYKGAEESRKRTLDNKLGFFNKRSEVYWKFREALDPDQQGGSPMALPDDPELVSDLTAPTFEVIARGIKILSKEEVCEALGRSPDKGDAVVMAWSSGARAATHSTTWRAEQKLKQRRRFQKVDLGPRRRF